MFCRTVLNYTGEGGRLGDTPVEVDIADGRAADLPGWPECGFELVPHASSLRTWDDETIASVHYGEAEELARHLTGCDFALVSDHVTRNGAMEKGAREQAPIPLVHSDFAADYDEHIRSRYRDVRGRGAAALARADVTADDITSAKRTMMLQLWRNIGEAKMDRPLAFCDNRSLQVADVRPFRYTGYVAGAGAFDALSVVPPEPPREHAWFTFPEMRHDEVVAFRTYDTDLVRDERPWFTPHTAFRDPEVELGRPARRSTELRVICVFNS